jgi:hypothetical protein
MNLSSNHNSYYECDSPMLHFKDLSQLESSLITSWSCTLLQKLLTYSRGISHILLVPKVHYCIHQSRPLVPILSQILLVHAISSNFLKNHPHSFSTDSSEHTPV